MPICHSCNKPFPDFKELARHIIANKKTHRKGLFWAQKHLMNQRALDKKATMLAKNHNPLTEEDKENKKDTRRVLSGQLKNANTFCPKCKRAGIYQFPIEYAESPDAWRTGKSLVKLCVNCGG